MESRATRGLVIFLYAAVVVMAACDVALVITAPWWLRTVFETDLWGLRVMLGYNYAVAGMIYPLMLAFFIISGLLCLGILVAAFRILGRIRRDMPFCMENASSLRSAAFCAFGLCAVFLLKMFFSPSVLTLVCGGIFLLFGLFVTVMSQLVRVAARMKEENDLTI